MPEYEIRKWKVVAVKKRKSVKIPSRSIHSSVLISFAVFRASNRVFHPFHSGLYSKCRLHVHSQNCIQRERERREYDAFLAIDVHGDVLDSSREIKLRNERRSLEKIIFFFCFPLSFVSITRENSTFSRSKETRIYTMGIRIHEKKPLKIFLPNAFDAHFHFHDIHSAEARTFRCRVRSAHARSVT